MSPRARRLALPILALAIGVIALGTAAYLTLLPRGGSTVSIGGPFTLTAGDGRTVTDRDFRGAPHLVFFGFTHCPDVCPTTLDVLAQSAQALKTHAQFGTAGQVLFVSLDPERDTSAVIADYVRYFSPDMLGATGTPEALKTLARALGVLFMKVEQGDSAYSIDHSAGVFYIDPQARLVSVLTPPHTVAGVTARFDAISNFIETQ